ncbi:hypothetical protein QJS04_geneDACA016005 [Acorus gramineus]|uniref:Cw7 protein n=1 Tax=Acorus gramineus TaxID=55184 RepID=A0AAV9BHE6_ACOGR|nr:hypothetical protein QJS04_geneDACA016005 [Acorus gramineus]
MADDKDLPIESATNGEETPSRYELLNMVKKHSSSLTPTNGEEGEEEDPTDVEMDGKFWMEMVDLYFVRDSKGRRGQDDDLVFFVRNLGLHGYGFNDNLEGNSPYFVRRWAPKLEKVVGENSGSVDWRRSFYLNMIAHTSFSVTVAICSIHTLQKHQSGAGTPLSTIYKVVKPVYASPSRVNFQSDFKKGVETVPAYPNICFAVDDFDDTFDAVVLSEADHCFCVLLNVHDGAAFPAEEEPHDCVSSGLSLRTDADFVKSKPSKLTLFSGFVSYQMVREAYDDAGGKFGLGSLLSIGNIHAKTDRIYMRGPGGRGEVEVAVSGVADQSQQTSGPASPIQLSKRNLGIGLGMIVRKAASVASEAAKHAYAAASASATSRSHANMLPLKCCLMSISLPWEHIAHDLLFKAIPPVDM